MADQYCQIPAVDADGNDSQSATTWRWSKKGVALSVSCLVLVAIVTAHASTFTLYSSPEPESTSLLGLSRSLRSPLGGAAKSGILKPMGQQGAHSQNLNMYGIGSSPMAKLALTALQANHLSNQGVRDVSLQAQMKSQLASMDKQTRAEVEKVEEAVKGKAASMMAKDLPGVTAPTGFFDPFGFTSDISEGRLLFLREAELKHGRVCMLAALGIIVGERYHPLFGGDINVPAYVAFQQTPLQTFWVAVLATIGLLEIPSINTFSWPAPSSQWSMTDPGRVPGDFGFDPFGFKPKDPEKLKDLQTKEINNGRLAMLAAAGMIAEELVTGKQIDPNLWGN